ncbi:MAG: ERF family protein [Cetobacterium sp.]
MSIYKKLLEVQKQIIGLKKDKKSFTYEYVTGNKLLGFLKPIMNEQGLLLKQEIEKVEKETITYKTKSGEKTEVLYSVDFTFTWIDVETGEKDTNKFHAAGMNDWEKGLGSALTYAERYFLLKFFHIATDEDDIDNPERKANELKATKEKAVKLIQAVNSALKTSDLMQLSVEELREKYKEVTTK